MAILTGSSRAEKIFCNGRMWTDIECFKISLMCNRFLAMTDAPLVLQIVLNGGPFKVGGCRKKNTCCVELQYLHTKTTNRYVFSLPKLAPTEHKFERRVLSRAIKVHIVDVP